MFCLTFDAKAAGVQCGTLGGGDIDLQTQLFQRPAVRLGHILAGSSNVSLWHKQAAQAHVDVLQKGQQEGERINQKNVNTMYTLISYYLSVH